MSNVTYTVSEQTASVLSLQAAFCKLIDNYYTLVCDMWGEDVAEARLAEVGEHKEALWDKLTQLLGESVRQNLVAVNNPMSMI